MVTGSLLSYTSNGRHTDGAPRCAAISQCPKCTWHVCMGTAPRLSLWRLRWQSGESGWHLPRPGVPPCMQVRVRVWDCAYVGEHVLGMWARAIVPKRDGRSVSEQKCVLGLWRQQDLDHFGDGGSCLGTGREMPPRESLTHEGWCC